MDKTDCIDSLMESFYSASSFLLNSILDLFMTPRQAYEKARDMGPTPEIEAIIAKDAHWAYHYARYVLQAPFPLGEEAISKDETVAREYVLSFGDRLSEESLEKFRDTLKDLVREL